MQTGLSPLLPLRGAGRAGSSLVFLSSAAQVLVELWQDFLLTFPFITCI